MNSKSEETQHRTQKRPLPSQDWDTYRLSAVFTPEDGHTWVSLMREGDPVRPTLQETAFTTHTHTSPLKKCLRRVFIPHTWITMHAHAGASRNTKQASILKPKTAALHSELIDHQTRKSGGGELASCSLKQSVTDNGC